MSRVFMTEATETRLVILARKDRELAKLLKEIKRVREEVQECTLRTTGAETQWKGRGPWGSIFEYEGEPIDPCTLSKRVCRSDKELIAELTGYFPESTLYNLY